MMIFLLFVSFVTMVLLLLLLIYYKDEDASMIQCYELLTL